ncbi:hypothetical protein SAMN06265367_1069 [Algoriphagus winogradskyi]|uniref:Uncharacterized protein n=1 Tax=Algoriphagus winogradskyi TaxID=237017 RepID=A0ABY1P7Q9_9BACT|nr:hypothetical protein SAMN06265367_1069 [Algoriphagus winogradskyi]
MKKAGESRLFRFGDFKLAVRFFILFQFVIALKDQNTS